MCSFIAAYERYRLFHPLGRAGAGSHKALPRSQRGPRGVATSAPLHCNKAAAAIPGGPYGRKTVTFPDKIHGRKPGEIFAPEKP